MGLPADLLRRPPREAARRIALERLDQARGAAVRLEDESYAEALHDFRVALRRLRSVVRSWRDELEGSVGRKHRLALRAIQVATGAGRDAEVALEWLARQRETLDARQSPGAAWLGERLERRLAQSMESAREEVRSRFEAQADRLQERLEVLQLEVHLGEAAANPTFAAALARAIREHLQEFAQHLAGVASPEDRENAHAARIRLKRVRYLLEPAQGSLAEVEPALRACKRLQDVLGELNDAHVLGAELEASLAEAARTEEAATLEPGLAELVRRNEMRRLSLFRTLERDVLASGPSELAQALEQVAAAAEASLRLGVEVERKYLLSALPEFVARRPAQEIDQGWLPGKLLRERVRRVSEQGATRCYRTIKLGSGLERVELEDAASPEVFEALWPLTDGCRVRKRRYRVDDGGRTWEIDEFLDRPLWLAEVELPDAGTVVEPPEWLAPWIVREVTEERGFTNLELAR